MTPSKDIFQSLSQLSCWYFRMWRNKWGQWQSQNNFSQNARVHEASVCCSYDGDWVSIIAMLDKIYLLSAEIVFWWFILSLKLVYHTQRPQVVPPHMLIQKWPRIIKNKSFLFLNIFEPYLDIVVLLNRENIWKSSTTEPL